MLPTHWSIRYQQYYRSHGRDNRRLSLRKTLSEGREGMDRFERV
jgi:hypothetical protein